MCDVNTLTAPPVVQVGWYLVNFTLELVCIVSWTLECLQYMSRASWVFGRMRRGTQHIYRGAFGT